MPMRSLSRALACLVASSVLVAGCSAGDSSFEPAGPVARQGRDRIQPDVERTLRVLTGGVPTLARARFDVCSTGEKDKAKYPKSCTVVISRIVPGGTSLEDVSPSLTTFDDTLTSTMGCSSDVDTSLIRIEGDWQAEGGKGSPGDLGAATYDCDGHRVEIKPIALAPKPADLTPEVRLAEGTIDQRLEDHPFDKGARWTAESAKAFFLYEISVADDYYFTKF